MKYFIKKVHTPVHYENDNKSAYPYYKAKLKKPFLFITSVHYCLKDSVAFLSSSFISDKSFGSQIEYWSDGDMKRSYNLCA